MNNSLLDLKGADILNPAIWFVIFMPIFYMIIVANPSRQRQIAAKIIFRKERGDIKMSNDLIKSYIGKVCNISSGSFGTTYAQVKIVEVVDSWIKIEKKGKIDLVNADFIQSIKILPEKYQINN